MFRRAAALLVFLAFSTSVQAASNRIALVIGQGTYASLSQLANPVNDARRMAGILKKHGFDVMSCDGETPGCYNQSRADLLSALDRFKVAALGVDLAVVFYAGHGMETDRGNVLAPVDATVDCQNWQVSKGVLIEQFVLAASTARHKVIILDACRDNPMGQICPPLPKGKAPLSFADIKVPAARDFLLLTSTKPGQQAQDGPPGSRSPFASALFKAMEQQPGIYFDQVFNHVAKATIEATKSTGFTQLPETIVRGGAPEACLKGVGCTADVRAAALAVEIAALKRETARHQELSRTATSYLTEIEKRRGRKLTRSERERALAELRAMSKDLAARNDARGERALARLKAGDKTAAEKLFEEDLAAQEAAEQAAEQRRSARRKKMAANARNLAALNRYTNVTKSLRYYRKAVKYDPSRAQTWNDLARAAVDAGDSSEAARAYQQAAKRARDNKDPHRRYWATLGLGDIAVSQGRMASARRFYETASAIVKPIAASKLNGVNWQRNLSVSTEKIGNVLVSQGNLAEALTKYRATLALRERLASSGKYRAYLRRDLSIAHNKIGDVLLTQGKLGEALSSYRASLKISEELVRRNPKNLSWQRDLSVSYGKVGNIFVAAGKLSNALVVYNKARVIAERLARSDKNNTGWQRDLGISYNKVGSVLHSQGQLRKALESFQAAKVIAERLAASDANNARWQRDLSVSHNKVGDVYVAQKKLRQALDSYKAALSIRRRLSKMDRNNTSWQRDLGVANNRIGSVLAAQRKLPEALASFQAGFAMAERLALSDVNNARWQRDLALSHNNIGKVYLRQKKFAKALASYEASKAISERLTKSDAGNARWKRDLSVAYNKIGDIHVALKQKTSALASYKASLAIVEGLARSETKNIRWQRDLWVSYWRLAKYQPKVYWPKVIGKLQAMDRKGILSDGDRKWIAIAEKRFAKVK
jgi:tetratricopeptide (TPR) repeat protein